MYTIHASKNLKDVAAGGPGSGRHKEDLETARKAYHHPLHDAMTSHGFTYNSSNLAGDKHFYYPTKNVGGPMARETMELQDGGGWKHGNSSAKGNDRESLDKFFRNANGITK